MKEKILTMKLLKENYAVCRLDKGEPIPGWAAAGHFYSITATQDELSIVCDEKNTSDDIKCEKGWRILKVQGPLDFSLIGILSAISTILARRGISIFALSTYDTDYILVKNNDLKNAIDALEKENYEVLY